ncbi:MAG: NADH-quinone oxidoreductase [Thermoprotei archaeon]|nr:MAG: NADH-quinone oxidoreductase [Thermoprotei archaeon]
MMFFEVIKLLFKKPFTNKFPVKYAPKNTHTLIKKVQRGEVKINPPVETPPGFRGKLEYDIDECVGCGLCAQVCPSKAIELVRDKKWIIMHCKDGAKLAAPLKIKIYVSRCVFCGQCVDICPRKCLRMSDEFLLANEDKLAEELIIPGP